MKKVLKILLPLLAMLLHCGDALRCQQRDTSAIMAKMREYLSAMDRLAPEAAAAEADLMVYCVMDSVLRNDVAVAAYRHFRSSKVMSADNVSVALYDNWFAPFNFVFPDIEELDEAEFHAFVNRASLLGKKVPGMKFLSAGGDSLAVPAKGNRASVLFFYSPGCPKCLYLAHRLCDIFKDSKYKLNLFLIYTGEDKAVWEEYRNKHLNISSNCHTKVWHLYGGDTPYVVPYSVIQTPRIFLLDGSGVIRGRMLDDEALLQLLQQGC